MSFAKEMQDFIGGWQAVSDSAMKRKESDSMAAYREATLALQTRQADLSERSLDIKEKNLNSRGSGGRSGKAEEAYYNSVLKDWEDADYDFESEDAGDGGGYARGGMVRKQYAAGGALILEEDPDLPFIDPENPYVDPKMNVRPPAPAPTMAIPDQPAVTPMGDAAGPAPTDDFEFAPDPAAEAAIVSVAEEATATAAPALLAEAQAPETAVGPGSEERMDIVKNTGGLSMEEWKSAVQTIDPNGTMPSYLKGAAVLGSTYKYFMENGQPEKAAKIAKGILITNKMMTQTLGSLAESAMERGDTASAAKLLTDAGNAFPTGEQFSIKVDAEGNLTYSAMEGGKVTEEGVLSTDEFWQLATGVKNGSLYLEEMGRIAQNFGGGGTSKESALNALGGSYVSFVNARDAFEAAELSGVEGDELEALRSAALQASNSFLKQQEAAMKMGVKRTDITAITKQAADMAIPDAPAAAAAPEEGGGFMAYLADGLDPSKYGEASAAMQPGQNPEAVAGATPQGNAGLRPASPADLANARAAIANGADPEAVARRFIESGFSPEGL